MCGRFVSARKRQELLAEFAVERDRTSGEKPADYNVAPTKQIYAVVDRREGEEDKETRELRLVRWGLVPFWAKDVSGGSRMINARAETVASKPAFRAAFARRRCLIPADGYYEWMPAEGGSAEGGSAEGGSAKGGSKIKQPYYIHRTDSGVLAFAGIYELWRDKSLPDDNEGSWLWTASIITTDATDDLGRIHDRMPMMISGEHWAEWLDPENKDTRHLMATMLPAAPSVAGGLTSYPVSTAVNSVRNNGPDLIAPVPAGG
jgi:putative SOS response-associated peptidase YedK